MDLRPLVDPYLRVEDELPFTYIRIGRNGGLLHHHKKTTSHSGFKMLLIAFTD